MVVYMLWLDADHTTCGVDRCADVALLGGVYAPVQRDPVQSEHRESYGVSLTGS